MAKSSVRVDQFAIDRLKVLKADVRREFGIPSRNEDIASAVLLYIFVPQVAGMLTAFYSRWWSPTTPTSRGDPARQHGLAQLHTTLLSATLC